MRFKIYKKCILATIVSILGALAVYGGIMALFAKEFLAGVICFVVGVLIQVGAEQIAEGAAFKRWKKEVIAKGYANKVAMGNYTVAVQLYNQNTGERTLKYFESLNPTVGARLRSAVKETADKKAAEAKKPEPAKPASTGSAAAGQSAQTNRCAACGTVLQPNDRFCIQCGTKVEKVKKCLRCGSNLVDGSKFCAECGYQVK